MTPKIFIIQADPLELSLASGAKSIVDQGHWGGMEVWGKLTMHTKE